MSGAVWWMDADLVQSVLVAEAVLAEIGPDEYPPRRPAPWAVEHLLYILGDAGPLELARYLPFAPELVQAVAVYRFHHRGPEILADRAQSMRPRRLPVAALEAGPRRG